MIENMPGRQIAGTIICQDAATFPTAVATFPRILRQPIGLNDVNQQPHTDPRR